MPQLAVRLADLRCSVGLVPPAVLVTSAFLLFALPPLRRRRERDASDHAWGTTALWVLGVRKAHVLCVEPWCPAVVCCPWVAGSASWVRAAGGLGHPRPSHLPRAPGCAAPCRWRAVATGIAGTGTLQCVHSRRAPVVASAATN